MPQLREEKRERKDISINLLCSSSWFDWTVHSDTPWDTCHPSVKTTSTCLNVVLKTLFWQILKGYAVFGLIKKVMISFILLIRFGHSQGLQAQSRAAASVSFSSSSWQNERFSGYLLHIIRMRDSEVCESKLSSFASWATAPAFMLKTPSLIVKY